MHLSLYVFYSLVCVSEVEVDQHCGAFMVPFSYAEQALMPLVLEVITLHVRHIFLSAALWF